MRRALVIVGCLVAIAVLAATQSQYISGNLVVGGNIADPNGTNWIKDAPGAGGPFLRQSNDWVSAGSSGGDGDILAGDGIILTGNGTNRLAGSGDVTVIAQVEEAPADGSPYVRRDGTWNLLSEWASLSGHNHDASNIVSGTLATARLGSGSASGSVFLAGDSSWKAVEWSVVASKPSTFSPSSHSHDWSDITGEPTEYPPEDHTHDAADVVSGVLDVARLGTGTPNTNVFLRGDGTWATVTVDPGNTNGLADAPSDGVFYGRKSGGWTAPDATDITSGTFASARLSGSYSGVTGLGTLSALTVTGTSTLKATQSGSSFSYWAGWNSDPTSSGSVLYWRSSSQLLSDIGGAAVSHIHPISDITDLQDELDNKSNVGHSHAISDITGLQAELDSKATNGHTHPNLAPFVFVTVSEVTDTNEDTTFRSILGTVKSGYSATLGANTLPSGTVLHFQAAGKFEGDDNYQPKIRLKIGSSYYLEFVCNEPFSSGSAPSGTPWNLEAWITVTSAGSSASVLSNGWLVQQTDASTNPSTTAADSALRSRAVSSGTLNTTTSNAVDLVYAGQDTAVTSFSCTHAILRQY